MGRKGVARGPRYTPEEDAIIMAYYSTADAQAALRAAGYERGLVGIRARKKEIRKKEVNLTGDQLFAERESLIARFSSNRRERHDLEHRLIEVSLAMRAQERMQPVEDLPDTDREAVIKRVEEILTAIERED